MVKVCIKGHALTVWQAFVLAAVAGDRKGVRLWKDRWGWLLTDVSPRDLRGLREVFPGRVLVRG
ncbi:MAG: hypothetical protein AB2448_07280 [Moorella sp. (in: firmicutes)]